MERKRERARKRDRMRERNDQPICEARGREREYMENTNETEVNTMDQFSVLQCVEVCCVCCSVVQCGAV